MFMLHLLSCWTYRCCLGLAVVMLGLQRLCCTDCGEADWLWSWWTSKTFVGLAPRARLNRGCVGLVVVVVYLQMLCWTGCDHAVLEEVVLDWLLLFWTCIVVLNYLWSWSPCKCCVALVFHRLRWTFFGHAGLAVVVLDIQRL